MYFYTDIIQYQTRHICLAALGTSWNGTFQNSHGPKLMKMQRLYIVDVMQPYFIRKRLDCHTLYYARDANSVNPDAQDAINTQAIVHVVAKR